MATRRPLLKRACLWTAAVVLLLAYYLAMLPVVTVGVHKFAPRLDPAVKTLYAPVEVAIRYRIPGSGLYWSYLRWCFGALGVQTPRSPP